VFIPTPFGDHKIPLSACNLLAEQPQPEKGGRGQNSADTAEANEHAGLVVTPGENPPGDTEHSHNRRAPGDQTCEERVAARQDGTSKRRLQGSHGPSADGPCTQSAEAAEKAWDKQEERQARDEVIALGAEGKCVAGGKDAIPGSREADVHPFERSKLASIRARGWRAEPPSCDVSLHDIRRHRDAGARFLPIHLNSVPLLVRVVGQGGDTLRRRRALQTRRLPVAPRHRAAAAQATYRERGEPPEVIAQKELAHFANRVEGGFAQEHKEYDAARNDDADSHEREQKPPPASGKPGAKWWPGEQRGCDARDQT